MRFDLPDDRPRLETTANDGGLIALSPIVETDRDVLAAGLEELSAESRHSRFGQAVAKLSQSELDYLSSVDQRDHVAWGAIIDGEVAGVGRYIVAAPGDCAEVAVTVIDAHQRRGVGTVLSRALVAVARHDGVRELYFEAQADNTAVIHVMEALGLALFTADGTIGGMVRVADLPVDPVEADAIAVIESVRG